MIPLIFSFGITLIILLIILRFAKIDWRIKAGFIALSVSAVVSFYFGLQTQLGYPLKYIPDGILIVRQIDTREPDGYFPKGKIFVWYIDLDKSIELKHLDVPRAIEIPFNKENQRTAATISQQIEQGKDVFIQFKKNTNSKNAAGNFLKGQNLVDNKNGGIGDEDGAGVMDFVAPPNTASPKVQN